LVELGRDAVEGQYFSTHYHPDVGSEKSHKFVEAYKKVYGSAPDAMAALGYDSMLILADAIKRAGSTTGAKVRDALAATKDFDAVTGKITIDQNRDASKAAVIIKVENGKFKYMETIAP
jgi:branched-chain amino acid transport system substrate-binding protein